MAEQQDQSQKTEEPTPKRLEEAHKKGEVVKSQEVKHWFMIIGGTGALLMFASTTAPQLTRLLVPFLSMAHQYRADSSAFGGAIANLAGNVAFALGPPIMILMLTALLGNMVQHKPVFAFEKVKPQWNKLSPLAGAKRLFSINSVVEFLKSIAKLVIVGTVITILISPEWDRLETLVTYEPAALMELIASLVFRILGGVIVILGFIAALDYAFQTMQTHKKQRMTKQEVREEHKQLEGDPQVKARLRQIRMERARQRMMASVPDATVVITNPTHYAIALRYIEGEMDAPRVVAKGADDVAMRIREVATEHDVPLVENPPLARALYATVELDDTIPSEHYKAVAEVIGYVVGLNARRRHSPFRPAPE